MKLNEKLATIQTKFKSKKSRFNSFGKYNFRSAEDILEATKPYLLELGVSVTITERLVVESNQDFPILESTAVISDGEDTIRAHAVVGVDLATKDLLIALRYQSYLEIAFQIHHSSVHLLLACLTGPLLSLKCF